MFKKNTFIKVEFLPEGKPLISVHIDNSTDANLVANFINKLLVKEYLEPLLEKILIESKKNKALDVGEEIVEQVLSLQTRLEVKLIPPAGRNPLIKPSAVMKSFEGQSHDDE